MSDHYIGLDLFGLENNGLRQPISRITLYRGDNAALTAGDDTGLEVVADCIYVTQEMVDALLSAARGYQYHAYSAQAARLNPAAELGDTVEVGSIVSVLAQISDNGDLYPDIAAPGDKEVEDEYPAAGPLTKAFDKKLAEARSEIAKTTDQITLAIYGEDGKGGLNGKMATFTVSLSTINSKVESVETKAAEDLEAAKNDFNVTLKSYSTIEQTAKKIATEVKSVKEYTDGKISDLDSAVSLKYSTIEQTDEKIATRVAKGSIISEINQSAETVQISASKINLNGYVTFSDLKSSTKTEINGDYITTGTVDAKRIKLYGPLNVYKKKTSSTVGGYLGYVEGWNPYTKEEMEDDEDLTNPNIGIGVMNSDVTGQCICTDTFARLSFGNYSAVLVEEGYLQLNGYGAIYFGLSEGTLTAEGHPNEFKDYALLDDETFRCVSDGLLMLGTASRSWDVLYAGSCSCCDSDLNKKNSIEELPDKYLAMFDNLEPVRFKLNKGKSGRFHVGYIAQEVKMAMDAADIDSTEFGGWVMDTDEDGNEIYMLRYEEFGAIYAAKIKQLEARLKRLEETT